MLCRPLQYEEGTLQLFSLQHNFKHLLFGKCKNYICFLIRKYGCIWSRVSGGSKLLRKILYNVCICDNFSSGFPIAIPLNGIACSQQGRNCVQVKSTCVGNLYSFPGIFYSKSIFQLWQFLLHNLGIFFAQKLFSLKIFIQTLIIMLIKCSVDQT